MKRAHILFFLIVCFAVFFSASCSKDIPSVGSEVTPSVRFDVFAEGKNYKVETSVSNGDTEYHCYIFNNNGKVMYEEILEQEPGFLHLDNDILQKETGYRDRTQYQYFNK